MNPPEVPAAGEARAFVGVASNIDPWANVFSAIRLLTRAPLTRVVGISTFYRTPALPAPGTARGPAAPDPDFLNGVVEIRTALTPPGLSSTLHDIEDRLGRKRTADKFAPRTMDLDLLLFLPRGKGESAAQEGGSPHPEIRTRAFVAFPLLELAPTLVLPDGTSLEEIVAAFPGPGGVAEAGYTEELRARFLSP